MLISQKIFHIYINISNEPWVTMCTFALNFLFSSFTLLGISFLFNKLEEKTLKNDLLTAANRAYFSSDQSYFIESYTTGKISMKALQNSFLFESIFYERKIINI